MATQETTPPTSGAVGHRAADVARWGTVTVAGRLAIGGWMVLYLLLGLALRRRGAP